MFSCFASGAGSRQSTGALHPNNMHTYVFSYHDMLSQCSRLQGSAGTSQACFSFAKFSQLNPAIDTGSGAGVRTIRLLFISS